MSRLLLSSTCVVPCCRLWLLEDWPWRRRRCLHSSRNGRKFRRKWNEAQANTEHCLVSNSELYLRGREYCGQNVGGTGLQRLPLCWSVRLFRVVNTWTRLLRLMHLTGPPSPDVHVVAEACTAGRHCLKGMLGTYDVIRQLQLQATTNWHKRLLAFCNKVIF